MLFSIIVNDINFVHLDTNLLIKSADHITLSIPIGPNLPDDSSLVKFRTLNFGQVWSLEIKPNQDTGIGNEGED